MPKLFALTSLLAGTFAGLTAGSLHGQADNWLQQHGIRPDGTDVTLPALSLLKPGSLGLDLFGFKGGLKIELPEITFQITKLVNKLLSNRTISIPDQDIKQGTSLEFTATNI